MTNKMFVEKLKLLAPSSEILRSRNIPENFIDRLLGTYFCERKGHRTSQLYSDNELIKLVLDYDCSSVEIGIINFLPDIIDQPSHYQFGDAEQDMIVIDKITLGVNVVDPAEPSHVIWKCASGGEAFLDALLSCAEYFTARMLDFTLMSDNAYASFVAKECSEKAGGNEYLKFYKMLFGFND